MATDPHFISVNNQTLHLPPAFVDAVGAALNDWQTNGKAARLWAGDASLWTNQDEAKWLGWLNIAAEQLAQRQHFAHLAAEVKEQGFTQVVVLGMGGSSLAPEVLARTFGPQAGFPQLMILDSTDPAQIRTLESELDLSRTLFIVSSKSGSTLEPNLYHRYFYHRLEETLGFGQAGSRFVAVTDPGSPFEAVAKKDNFRHVYYGVPSIGGRYSALSNFGMIPAAAAGLDVVSLLTKAQEMTQACAAAVAAEKNPGLVLGAVLGTLGNQGHNKITILASPAVASYGAWLEQLLAESTGKDGKGLIPVDGEALAPPTAYGQDRLFIYVRFTPEADPQQDNAVNSLVHSGLPVVRIDLTDRYELGAEFYRWEFATAVAGSILGINAFNQPDVEASKIATRELTTAYEKTGELPTEKPLFAQDGIELYADEANAKVLAGNNTLVEYLRAYLQQLQPGDYFALLAYIERNEKYNATLQGGRTAVRDAFQVATCLGFGPRFLHSTGQAYKGGPNTGVFLQVTAHDATDLPCPGQKYTFGIVKAAEAQGDLKVLDDRHRRALRVHLQDLERDLPRLMDAVVTAVGPKENA